MTLSQVALVTIGAYLALGTVFGVAFAFGAVDRLDPAARGAGWRFRLLIVPGAAALWPLLIARTLRAGRTR